MLLCYTHVYGAVGHGIHHYLEGAARRHCGRNAHNERILLRQFQYSMPKHILVFRWFGNYNNFLIDFARYLVEGAGGMPQGLVLLGKVVAFPFYCFYVQQLRAGYIVQAFKCFGELQYVMPVNRAKVAQAQRLKQVTAFRHHALHTCLHLRCQPLKIFRGQHT